MTAKPTAPTRLAQKLAGAATSPVASPVSTPLKRSAAAGRRGAERTVPLLGRVWIELPGAREWQNIETTVRRVMMDTGVGELSIATAGNWEGERALRVCAAAFKDPEDHSIPFGTLEEWEGLDNDAISPAWLAFGDVRNELDPLSQPATDEEIIAIQIAVKKKDRGYLRTFGSEKVFDYLLSMADPPSTSPTPSSENGPTPPSSSDST